MTNKRRLISLDDVLRKLKAELLENRGVIRSLLLDVICYLENQPVVDAVEVVHGRWIHTAIEDDNWGGTFHKWTCSNCDFSTGHNPNGTNYCPNCGAKMDGERKDNGNL